MKTLTQYLESKKQEIYKVLVDAILGLSPIDIKDPWHGFTDRFIRVLQLKFLHGLSIFHYIPNPLTNVDSDRERYATQIALGQTRLYINSLIIEYLKKNYTSDIYNGAYYYTEIDTFVDKMCLEKIPPLGYKTYHNGFRFENETLYRASYIYYFEQARQLFGVIELKDCTIYELITKNEIEKIQRNPQDAVEFDRLLEQLGCQVL